MFELPTIGARARFLDGSEGTRLVEEGGTKDLEILRRGIAVDVLLILVDFAGGGVIV